jgi:hypothetical protein
MIILGLFISLSYMFFFATWFVKKRYEIGSVNQYLYSMAFLFALAFVYTFLPGLFLN